MGLNIPRDRRRAELSRKYFFHCECEACEEAWPSAMDPEMPKALNDVPQEQFKIAFDDVRRLRTQFAKVSEEPLSARRHSYTMLYFRSKSWAP